MFFSFNFWEVALTIAIIIAVVMAKGQYIVRIDRYGRYIEKQYGVEPYLLLSAVASMIVAILLVVESTTGIIQFIDNRLVAGETEMVVGLLFWVFWLAFSVSAGMMVLVAGAIASWFFRIRTIVKSFAPPILDKDGGKEPKPRPVKRPADRRSPTGGRHQPKKAFRTNANYGMR